MRSLLFDTLSIYNKQQTIINENLELILLKKIQHPLLILHIRRTDKWKERSKVQAYRRKFRGYNLPWTEYKRWIQHTEFNLNASFKSVVLLTDDLETYDNVNIWKKGFNNEHASLVFLNPFWLEHNSTLLSEKWKKNGHYLLRPHYKKHLNVQNFHEQLIADVAFAVKHGDFLMGCGTSGISQYIAQGLGRKNYMDGNHLAAWEEDFFRK